MSNNNGSEKKLKLTLPKGSLWDTVQKFFNEAGYNLKAGDRDYRPALNDPEIQVKLLRPQEIPNYLTYPEGFDLGISGSDWVKESGADVEIVLDLKAGKVRLVFCIPNTWKNIKSMNDFVEEFHKQNRIMRISTEYINLSINKLMACPSYKKYYGDKIPTIITPWKTWGTNEKIKIYLSFGATEAKPPEEVDAIIDNTETGSTLRANNLDIIETLDSSSAVLIANKESLKDEWKREKIEDIKILLAGVREARKKIHIFMNVREENLKTLLDKLPALKRPTIAKLAGKDSEGWWAINTIIDKDQLISLIPTLRKLAQGIVIHEPRQVIET